MLACFDVVCGIKADNNSGALLPPPLPISSSPKLSFKARYTMQCLRGGTKAPVGDILDAGILVTSRTARDLRSPRVCPVGDQYFSCERQRKMLQNRHGRGFLTPKLSRMAFYGAMLS